MQLIIDNKTVNAQEGMTVLEAARENNIYIPTLCDHKDLTPWAACRMCIVEIEGMRGLPTACTTRIAEGMNVKTQTLLVKKERYEIMQLMMASHPAGCVVCEARGDCSSAMDTIRKSTVTTGCGSCPNNGQCEFLSVAEKVGVETVKYPRWYRNLPIENEDPFYDRDYNLCIICGRCVRVCEQIRLPDVLTFTKRGSSTKVGTAYERSHIEAGCEFCGACVAVCPTGTLSEKFRKWDGVPEDTVQTTCALCDIGCQVDLLVKDNRVIGSLPGEDPLINHGQLCVKGRFGIAEMLGNYRRLTIPLQIQDGVQNKLSWDEAVAILAEKLAACQPDKFGMVVSTDNTNENLYAAQKFTRMVMGSHHIDTTARLIYGDGINNAINYYKQNTLFTEIKHSDFIFSLFLDTRYGRSVIGVEIKQALVRGAKLATFHTHSHNLIDSARIWVKPVLGKTTDELRFLLRELKNPSIISANSSPLEKSLGEIAKYIKSSSNIVFLVGPEIFDQPDCEMLLPLIQEIAQTANASVFPFFTQSNLLGSLMMGTYPELITGGQQYHNQETMHRLEELWGTCLADIPEPTWNISKTLEETDLDVLYVVGDVPLTQTPSSKFTIFQNIYPPPTDIKVDLILPSAAFTEENGSLINREGRIQSINKAVNSPGAAMPDWEIFKLIAQKMGFNNFLPDKLTEIQYEIDTAIQKLSIQDKSNREPHNILLNGKLTLTDQIREVWGSSMYENTYRGFPISQFVKDMGRILDEKPNFYPKQKILKPIPVIDENAHHTKEIITGTGMFPIVESRILVPNIHLLTVQAPLVAQVIRPGEFVIVRAEEDGERIPLSVADWDRETGELTFLIMNVGRTSRKLSMLKPGMTLPTVAGPLGNALEINNFGTALLVGGCYGVGSIQPLARALKQAGNVVYAAVEARSAHLFYWEDKLAKIVDKVFYITRDGSKGYQGHIRSQLPKIIESIGTPIDRIFVNGCNFLLRMSSEATIPYGIKTMVSLNTLMIDGTGMCGVCRVSVDGSMKFACVDGPYFDGHSINWSELDQRRKSYMKEEVETLRTVSMDE